MAKTARQQNSKSQDTGTVRTEEEQKPRQHESDRKKERSGEQRQVLGVWVKRQNKKKRTKKKKRV